MHIHVGIIAVTAHRADNGSVGQMGQQIWMGHMGHGSVSVTHWPTSKSIIEAVSKDTKISCFVSVILTER